LDAAKKDAKRTRGATNNAGRELVKTPIKATTMDASAALAALLTIGTPSMSPAATFVFMSVAEVPSAVVSSAAFVPRPH
jgi:hypothetical protein